MAPTLNLASFLRTHLRPSNSPSTTECPICHDPYGGTHIRVRVVENPSCPHGDIECTHEFGLPCLERWLDSGAASSNSCPLCRRIWFLDTASERRLRFESARYHLFGRPLAATLDRNNAVWEGQMELDRVRWENAWLRDSLAHSERVAAAARQQLGFLTTAWGTPYWGTPEYSLFAPPAHVQVPLHPLQVATLPGAASTHTPVAINTYYSRPEATMHNAPGRRLPAPILTPRYTPGSGSHQHPTGAAPQPPPLHKSPAPIQDPPPPPATEPPRSPLPEPTASQLPHTPTHSLSRSSDIAAAEHCLASIRASGGQDAHGAELLNAPGSPRNAALPIYTADPLSHSAVSGANADATEDVISGERDAELMPNE
ncbi:hypothetical protein BU26DRAFT_550260 [Trematosphaeria pertusa]|uniref:RING-type domain-containing protein n=1 Tax=Trematosphaeria pertusa TaxID=390896 RepID=A0A6A6IHU3_9PLEO|nr:uncharacterized protein BU26DRAFT_550260 [Trematosphaeria pertusa]KAF2249981.1 hypothetical protein BU26DRAFT_550260 [Trematosphaeria pertusa]